MSRFKVACVFGTRPEVIKMAPVILALEALPEYFDVRIISTGQHRELLTPLVDWFGLKIDTNLDLMQANQGLNELCGKIIIALGTIFQKEKFDCVIGQGDTTTVFAASLAAFHEKIPFAHVEAGLRTYDRYSPFPEEMNRVLAGRLTTIHFPPTLASQNNLLKEGISANHICMTGNTVIDALKFTVQRLPKQDDANVNPYKKLILVTAHRRENFGEPLQRICQAILRIAQSSNDIRIVFSVHPNPNVKEMVYAYLNNIANVELCGPMPYLELVSYMAACDIVLTDSGGLQEEAPALNKPVLILREETERPECVELGGAKLVGSNEDLIVDSVTNLLNDNAAYKKMVLGFSPYGDGKAGQYIADHLITALSQGK